MSEAIRVFVGADPNGRDAEQQAVCEYTLRSRCSMPVELHWMRLSNDKASPWHVGKWDKSSFSTPFSAFRWHVPAFCGYAGKAIYTDVDVWWERDAAELWTQPFDGKVVMAAGNVGKPSYGVLFWDCAAAKGHIQGKPHQSTYMGANTRYFREHGELVRVWDGDWNCLDGGRYTSVTDTRIGLHHATRMGTQPSHKHALPRLAAAGQKHWYDGAISPHPRADYQARFDALLAEAIAAGYTLDKYVPAQRVEFTKKSYRGR